MWKRKFFSFISGVKIKKFEMAFKLGCKNDDCILRQFPDRIQLAFIFFNAGIKQLKKKRCQTSGVFGYEAEIMIVRMLQKFFYPGMETRPDGLHN